MAETSASYPFSSGDRLDNRNTYFYTPYGGRAFIDAWRTDRARVEANLPPPAASAPAASVAVWSDEAEIWSTPAWCENLFHEIAETPEPPNSAVLGQLGQLLRKFETTKRIHAAYRRGDFRAADPRAYRDPALYLRAGEIFEAAFGRTGSLQCLNVLLKVLDTLSGLAPSLDRDQGSRLARLIAAERGYVERMAARLGIAP
jgi:hypothetical protein